MAVARQLAAEHTMASPSGLSERIAAVLVQAHDGWVDQAVALELDEGSAEVARSIPRALMGADANGGQRSASVAEADMIVRDHQRRP
jgi:phosphotransferase system HPr-like phosphotransfer protein